VFVTEAAHVGNGLGHLVALVGLDFGIGVELRRVVLAEEQAIGEPQLLRTREKDFLRLFDLFLTILSRNRHALAPSKRERLEELFRLPAQTSEASKTSEV
jgi:hypothetical protein